MITGQPITTTSSTTTLDLTGMSPPLTMQHPPNRSLVNSKFQREFSSRGTAKMLVPYLSDLCITELGIVVSIASRQTSLLRSVLHVVFLSAQEKVRRITASSIITVMKYLSLMWNFSFCDCPRNSMRRLCSASELPLTVASLKQRSNPRPAIGFWPYFYTRKETFQNWRLFLPSDSCPTPTRFASRLFGSFWHGVTIRLLWQA